VTNQKERIAHLLSQIGLDSAGAAELLKIADKYFYEGGPLPEKLASSFCFELESNV
jgi:hypothetical protein